MMSRIEQARRRLEAEGGGVLVLPPGDDLFYLLGYTPHPDERPCYLFLSPEEVLFLVPELNAAEAAPHVPFPTITYADAQGPRAALREAHRRLGAPPLVAVGDTMRADALLLLQELWPQARFIPGGRVMAPLRMVKSAQEIAALHRAAATADAAVEAVFTAAGPGMREADLKRVAEDAFYAAGAQEVPFAIIAAGANSAFPHHSTSTAVGRAGDPILVDLGSRVDGYMSDITRMAFLGPPSARYREIHMLVEEAVRAALEAIRPGVPIREVDLAARRVIERAGYGDRFTHRTGHGIGVSVHEAPSVTCTNEQALEAGMTFSVEPGIYLPGEFGVRLEEIVVVTAQGPQILSRLPREVRVL
ncbi:MAG: Xaa-Pro peptidase family protein [Armatimonadota bacterium]|nr:Xaa-Pro peptidase family protein [Armatimonadota bacterium]MDR7539710.1 Xaa-Pro peptidase family protein [Armatimonadota bacterium]